MKTISEKQTSMLRQTVLYETPLVLLNFIIGTLQNTGQMAQVRRLEVWGSNPKPIKYPTHCQQLATAAVF